MDDDGRQKQQWYIFRFPIGASIMPKTYPDPALLSDCTYSSIPYSTSFRIRYMSYRTKPMRNRTGVK